MQQKRLQFLVLILGTLPFLFWIVRYITVDLWYDEVYSFDYFVLGGFKQTLFNYPLPNNHVFYNLTSQVLTRITGLRSLSEIADNVWVFRSFQVIISITTAYYCVKIISRFFKLNYSALIVPILFTCVPYLNFSLQLRGYNMSSLFMVMLIYYSLAFLESSSKRNRNWLTLSSFLLLYCIPSNSYLLASLGLILFFRYLYLLRRPNSDKKSYWRACLFIGIGLGFALVFYAPILKEIVSNPFSDRKPDNVYYSLSLIPTLIVDFLSKRYLLLVPIAFGLWYTFKFAKTEQKHIFIGLLVLLVAPFVLSFFHHKFPFDRTFIGLSPVFCLIICIPILYLIQSLHQHGLKVGLVIIIPIYCCVNLVQEMRSNETEIHQNLVTKNEMTQTIYQNYFLSRSFQPKRVAIEIKKSIGVDTLIKYHQIDYPATNLYLVKEDVNFIEINNSNALDTLFANVNTLYLLTSFENQTRAEILKYPSIKCSVVSNKWPFSTVLKLEQQ